MDIEAIFRQRDIAQAEATFSQLNRFAERRNECLDGLDFHQITASQTVEIHQRSDAIYEAIVFAELYLIHLADLDQLGRELRLSIAA